MEKITFGMLSRGQGHTNSKIMHMFCRCVIYVSTNELYRINSHFNKLCKISRKFNLNKKIWSLQIKKLKC